MGVDEALDITSEERKTVLSLLAQHLPETAAWVYGSRAKWTSRSQSDLDLVVFPTPAQRKRVGDLREALEESNLPFRVDLFVWDEVPDTFRERIHASHVTLVEGPEKDSVTAGSSRYSSHGWTQHRLVDLCDISRGASPRPIHSWIANHGTPWVKIADATASASRYIEQTRECILREGQSKSVTVFPGDLILSNSASPGIPRFMKIEACIHDGWLLLRNFRGLDRLFTYYLLLYERNTLVGKGTGSVFTNLKTETLKQHEVSVPNLGEQRAIAQVLGTLDDKIELNRRMNETLEATARAIFKDWFVDFGPSCAKAEGRAPYLAPKLWDLFPDALDDVGKPVGWTRENLGTLFDVSIGRTPPRKEQQHFVPGGSGETWLSIKAMRNIQTFALGSEEDLTPRAVKQFRVPLITAGTVMVSFKLTVGRVAIAANDMHSNEAIAHLVEKNETPVASVFTYCFMKGFDYDTLSSTSSIATAVNSKSIKAIEMIVPDSATHSEFVAIVQPLFDRILCNLRETETLSATRDLLLPRLMSGEIRLRDAEDVVEALT